MKALKNNRLFLATILVGMFFPFMVTAYPTSTLADNDPVYPPAELSVRDISICEGDIVDLTTAIYSLSGNLKFYRDAACTIPIDNPTNVSGITSTTAFYVTITDSHGVEGLATQFTVTVLPKPSFEISQENPNQTVCERESISIGRYTLQNVTGVLVRGLPPGIDYTFENGVLTIEGTPLSAGVYDYEIISTHDSPVCNPIYVTKSLTVNSAPIAAFTYKVDGNTVYFHDQSSVGDHIESWEWEFEGHHSGEQNPSLILSPLGGKATLKVTTDCGCSDEVTQMIEADPSIEVDFDVDARVSCLSGNLFTFTNKTILADPSADATYLWTFGDGTTSIEENPSHTYTDPGKYTISLQVSANGVTQSGSKAVTVHPEPELWVEDLEIMSGAPLDLTAAAKATSDAEISFYEDPMGQIVIDDPTEINGLVVGENIFYARATDPGTDCVSELKPFRVTVNTWVPQITGRNNVCPGTEITLTGTPAGGYWGSMDPGVAVISSSGIVSGITNGTVEIQYSVWDEQADELRTSRFAVTVGPQHTALSELICEGEGYNFFGSILTEPGTYSYKLLSSIGCDSIIDLTLDVSPLPVAGFEVVNTVYGENTFFSSTSSGDVVSYYWRLGDGTTSYSPDVTHLYSAPGIYQVALEVTNRAGCTSYFTQPVEITEEIPLANGEVGVQNSNLQVYPNPVRRGQFVTVETGLSAEQCRNARLSINDLSGKLVRTQAVTGVYLLLVYSGEVKKTVKVVVR